MLNKGRKYNALCYYKRALSTPGLYVEESYSDKWVDQIIGLVEQYEKSK